MNRIHEIADWPSVLPSSGGVSSSASSQLEAGKFNQISDSHHVLFAPLHYEANYAYPLIVWLHGAGDDERQLRRIMPLVSLRNYCAVAPRGTAAASEGAAGYLWRQTPEHIAAAVEKIDDAILAAKHRFNVNPLRIYLAGEGAGGTMAIRVAFRGPERFAGVLSLGGAMPCGHQPLARLNSIRGVQVFLASARESQCYRPEQVCQDLRLLYTAGMAVDLRQYPTGDGLSPQMLSDVDRWIMLQLAATAAVVSQSAPGAVEE